MIGALPMNNQDSSNGSEIRIGISLTEEEETIYNDFLSQFKSTSTRDLGEEGQSDEDDEDFEYELPEDVILPVDDDEEPMEEGEDDDGNEEEEAGPIEEVDDGICCKRDCIHTAFERETTVSIRNPSINQRSNDKDTYRSRLIWYCDVMTEPANQERGMWARSTSDVTKWTVRRKRSVGAYSTINYMFKGRPVCKDGFMYFTACTESQWKSSVKRVVDTSDPWVFPATWHGNKGRGGSDSENRRRIVGYIYNLAIDYGYPSPAGRAKCPSNIYMHGEIKLPPTYNKTYVYQMWREFCAGWEASAGENERNKPVPGTLRGFQLIWKNSLGYISALKPGSGFCDLCQVLKEKTADREIAVEAIASLNLHRSRAHKEKRFYRLVKRSESRAKPRYQFSRNTGFSFFRFISFSQCRST
jgi:hypothetical protein